MSQFHYYGRDTQGRVVEGIIERVDKNSVADYLQQQKITPVTIVNHADKTFSINTFSINWPQLSRLLKGHHVADEQLIMFCRQMATINKAGIPLAQGMASLVASLPEGSLKDTVADTVSRLQSGAGLAASLSHHPQVFNQLFISLVQVGEDSGNLDTIFLQLAYYLERDVSTRQSIKTATRYPLFVLYAMAMAMVVINIYVIPAFASMFSRFEANLPLPTRILISFSQFFVHYWPYIVVVSVIGIGYFIYWSRSVSGRVRCDEKKLSLPIVGSLIKKASLARYTRSFSLMLKSGVPLASAIELCSRVIDNAYLATKIRHIKQGVERGDSLSRTHARSGIFSPLILQMITVGENSGQIDSLLHTVAEHYDREVDYEIKTLASRLEPILIIIMAIFVLILALGIFLPMWEMYNVQS